MLSSLKSQWQEGEQLSLEPELSVGVFEPENFMRSDPLHISSTTYVDHVRHKDDPNQVYSRKRWKFARRKEAAELLEHAAKTRNYDSETAFLKKREYTRLRTESRQWEIERDILARCSKD